MAEHGARLLVVDDNKVNRLLLAKNLETQGHHVELAENGKVALEALRSDPFDLVLLDIEMPEMDGFEVLEEIMADPQLRDVPVIVTSAVEGLDNVVRCIELGAEDYLNKPVNPVLLRARIGSGLARKQLRDQQAEMVRRFATAEVAEDVLQSGFALGGRHVYATVMFSDIRGFTSISESQQPGETIEMLNNYYALMFEAITAHGGVVTSMMGDGLLAIFGAPLPLPDHQAAAVRAGIDMLEMVELWSAELVASGRPEVRIGIGVATGEMVAGYTGTQQRATYTCIGDIVNCAARLEGHTKVAGHPMLVDAETRMSLGPEFALVPIGEEMLKGKSQPVEVFAVVR